jgi:hypothetical protein
MAALDVDKPIRPGISGIREAGKSMIDNDFPDSSSGALKIERETSK